jgi:hypothetical protein
MPSNVHKNLLFFVVYGESSRRYHNGLKVRSSNSSFAYSSRYARNVPGPDAGSP